MQRLKEIYTATFPVKKILSVPRKIYPNIFIYRKFYVRKILILYEQNDEERRMKNITQLRYEFSL